MSPEAQRVHLRLLSVKVYKNRPITQPFPCKKFPFEFWLLQWQSDFPSVFENAPQTPTGISLKTLDALEAKYTDLITKIESSTPLLKEEGGVIPNIPPNLPELVRELEMAEGRKDLSPEVRNRLDENLAAAKKSIVETWEKRRLENIEEKLSAARKEELDSAKNSVVGELMVYANTKDESVVNDARFDIAQDLQNIILTASRPENPNKPRSKEEIYADINERLAGNTEKQLVGLLIEKYGLSAKTAQEVSTKALSNEAVRAAIENVRKTIFVEHALANQFPKFTSTKEAETVNPEALHSLADETIAAVVNSVMQSTQERQPKQAEVLSTDLFKILITKIIPPFNSPLLTSPVSMVQAARELTLVRSVEEFLQKFAPQVLRSVGPIKLDAIQSLILEAAGFSNTSWWKNSTASFEEHHPFGLIHPQVRNSIILNHGALGSLVALIPSGLVPSVKEFFNTNRGASWFGSFTKSVAGLPHIQFQFLHGISLPFLGRLYREDEWGYWVGPLARLKNTVFSKTIQFVGTNLIKMGTSKLMARLGGKILVSLGTKLLGFAAGGPAGLILSFAPEIISLLRKKASPVFGFFGRLKGNIIKFGTGLIAGGLSLLFIKLAQLGAVGAGVTAGGIIGSIVGFIVSGFNPGGAVVGGIVGGFLGGIIAGIISAISGGGGAASVTAATAVSAGAAAPPAAGLLATTNLAAASVLTATVGITGLSLYQQYTYQSAFQSETRQTGKLPYLDAIGELKTIFETIYKNPSSCIPLALLKAIAQVETGGYIFRLSSDEVKNFSTPGWDKDLDQTKPCCSVNPPQINYACNNNWCSNTDSSCAFVGPKRCDVVGPMQFEIGTFNGYKPALVNLWDHKGFDPSRANLIDALWAAALKIKANSGTAPDDCSNWSDKTITDVARAYCGSCGTKWCGIDEQKPGETLAQCQERSAACGEDYCGTVLDLYRQYK